MSQESLSALLDGECSPEELERLLGEMERDPSLKAQFSRMCVAREAAEGTRIARGQPCICAGVMAGLDAVPADESPRVRPLVRPPRSLNWKPLAGLAAAAAFGAVAVLVAVPRSGDITTVTSPQASPQISVPVNLPLPSARRPRNLQTVSATAGQLAEDDLRGYLMEHSSTVAERGVGGALSYARFTAHTADDRPQAQPQPAVAVEEPDADEDQR